MNAKHVFFGAVFVTALAVLPLTDTSATTTTTELTRHAPYSPRLAQNSDCDQARGLADTCWDSWQNIGGGHSGQAESFYQCMKNYCILLQAHGCNLPRRAQCP